MPATPQLSEPGREWLSASRTGSRRSSRARRGRHRDRGPGSDSDTGRNGGQCGGLVLAPVAAFLGITLWSATTIVSDAAELDMLEMSKHKSDKKTKSGTGTTTIVKPYDDDVKWYAVRMQAQGGGLQKSVAIRQATPVTVAQGLAALQAQLTARELRDRDVALALERRSC